MNHTEAERAAFRIRADIEESQQGLVHALLDHIATASRLAGDLTALDDANAPDLIFRLERFFGKHMTVLADVATLSGRIEELDAMFKTAAELEAEEIAAQEAAEDAREDAWVERNSHWLDMVTR